MTQPTEQGKQLPGWAQGDPLMEWYATEIWGRRLENDDTLFETMSLQVFQAGLSWRMILNRRDAFRRAFHGWRIDEVAAMPPPPGAWTGCFKTPRLSVTGRRSRPA